MVTIPMMSTGIHRATDATGSAQLNAALVLLNRQQQVQALLNRQQQGLHGGGGSMEPYTTTNMPINGTNFAVAANEGSVVGQHHENSNESSDEEEEDDDEEEEEEEEEEEKEEEGEDLSDDEEEAEEKDKNEVKAPKVKCNHPSECKRNAVMHGGLCGAHGGVKQCYFVLFPVLRRCKHIDDESLVVVEGVALRHARRCEKGAKAHGLCIAHGGGMKCCFEGCETNVQRKGLCVFHARGTNAVEANILASMRKGKNKSNTATNIF